MNTTNIIQASEFTRQEWCAILKTRFWSNLEKLTDGDIEDYINSLEGDKVRFEDKIFMIVADK